MASIKVCLVVIVFPCSNCASVHPEMENLMVGELIIRMARFFCVGTVHFLVGLAKNFRVGDKNYVR